MDLFLLAVEVLEGDEELVDVAEPGVGFGLVDTGVEVLADRAQLAGLVGVNLEELAADAACSWLQSGP